MRVMGTGSSPQDLTGAFEGLRERLASLAGMAPSQWAAVDERIRSILDQLDALRTEGDAWRTTHPVEGPPQAPANPPGE